MSQFNWKNFVGKSPDELLSYFRISAPPVPIVELVEALELEPVIREGASPLEYRFLLAVRLGKILHPNKNFIHHCLFAADLLMPKYMLLKWKIGAYKNGLTEKELSYLFQVTDRQMKIRLEHI